MARVKFIRDKEPNIKALDTNKTAIDGALYVATDTGAMWMGLPTGNLLQVKSTSGSDYSASRVWISKNAPLYDQLSIYDLVTGINTETDTSLIAKILTTDDIILYDGYAYFVDRVDAKTNSVYLNSRRTIPFVNANTGAQITVDDTLSDSSTNPVQNKVIKVALDGKANSVHEHLMNEIAGLANTVQRLDDEDEYLESNKAPSDIILVQSAQPTSRTCKIWIKI